jgi:tetratricopeptide (TPR) repeat protein
MKRAIQKVSTGLAPACGGGGKTPFGAGRILPGSALLICLLITSGAMADGVVPVKENAASDGTNSLVAGILAHSQARFGTTNLMSRGGGDTQEQARKMVVERLEMGRKQRENKLYNEARGSLAGIMEGEAPQEIWKSALIELALLAQDEGDLTKAQQVYSQYVTRWPQDPNVPELLLRQGLIFREMGLTQAAVSKFYAVMTSALVVQGDRLEHYQRMVLQAQVEVAETQYLAGKFAPAREALTRLLKQNEPLLNRAQVQIKLVRCLAELKVWEELVVQGLDFVKRFPQTDESLEVRFLVSMAMKDLGRKEDSLRQVQLLLEQEGGSPATAAYWKHKAGNDIANQLYKEGDYLQALDIYLALSALGSTPEWQCPVFYQVGLIYERLEQPAKAVETYQKILDREKEIGSGAKPSLKTVVDMARWRARFLGWQVKAEEARQSLSDSAEDPKLASTPPRQ